MPQPIVLLLGRKGIVLESVREKLSVKSVALLGGTSLDDVRTAFTTHDIDIVIMGAGIDLKHRVEIIEYIFNTSKSTTVHMKDWNSGPQGMTSFIDRILKGLIGQE